MKPSFPEAWSLVPQGSRTDRTKALIALLCMGAYPDGTWVSAGQVFDTIRLHLRNAAPQNTVDVLRKAAPDVTPKRDGGGLLWQLTDTGLQKLRSWGVADVQNQIATLGPDLTETERFDIAIVSALPSTELRAIYSAFGGKAAWKALQRPAFARVCHETRLPVMTGGDVRIVSAVTSTMGLTAAAIATTQLITEFRPRLVMMIGIAAGTLSQGRDFGDILVPDPSVDYASGKWIERAGIRSLEPDPYPLPINSTLKSLLQMYHNSDEPFDEIYASWADTKPTAAPKLHIGPVGASDQVVDAQSILKEVKKNWRKLIGVEMETYGVYRAAHESASRPLFVAFKSVCDFGVNKSDDWQPYAAHTAAHFARYFIARHWSDIVNIHRE